MTKWIKAATIRAIKMAAQTAIGAIGAATVFSAVDWRIVGGTVLLAMLTSYLTSLASLPDVDGDRQDKS